MSHTSSDCFYKVNFKQETISECYSAYRLFPRKSTWYHNLPCNVLVNIFQYFDEKEIRFNLLPVCQRWRYAALSPELWKSITVLGQRTPTSFIMQQVRQFSELETVHLDNILDPLVVIRQICYCCPQLKHLIMRNCKDITESALRNVIQCCRELETIDLRGTRFHGHRFFQELSGLKNFRSVNLSENSYLSVRNLLSVVLNCHSLEELRLSKWCPAKPLEQLSDEDAAFMLLNLSPTLRSITLDAAKLTNVTFQAVLRCNKLERLALYGATNLSAELFSKIWQNLPALTELKIRNAHQITGQDIAEFFTQGKDVVQNLVLLDLTGCWKLTDFSVEAIANHCPNLQVLALKGCKSLCHINAIQNKCTKIETLNIAFCTNLDTASILPPPKNLKRLEIDANNNYDQIVKQIKEILPDIQVRVLLSEFDKHKKYLDV